MGIESEILFHKGRSPNTEISLPVEQVMVKITEMDDTLTLSKLFETEAGPVILMNKFNVSPDEVEEFLKVFAETTKAFKQQPGFISAKLHQGIAGSSTFINYVVWESVAHFKQAFDKPEFRTNMAKVLPNNTVMSPHLFKKIAISGVCVDQLPCHFQPI
jgi:heme-degrading monooxygenase HmoA